MLPMALPFAVTLVASVLIGHSAAWTARGCVDLDSSTFDKVVGKFRYSLVKFDTAFPYGDKHEAFTNLALATVDFSDDLLFALVGIKDYGEKDNADLGTRFRIAKEYPVIKLFFGDQREPVDYPAGDEVTVDNLRRFLKRHTELYIGLPGCVQRFDELAQAFMQAHVPTDRQAVLAEAERIDRDTPEADPSKKSHAMYLSLMRKIAKSGEHPADVVREEIKRVEKLLAGKLSEAKKTELKQRTNVMLSFTMVSESANRERAEL